MTRFVGGVIKSIKRRTRRERKNRRPVVILDGARRLLAERDFDQISIAEISKVAGCSVGSFYYAFRSKEEFLHELVETVLEDAVVNANQNLQANQMPRNSALDAVHALIEEMMRSLHGPTAGVVRVALKRGHLDRKNLQPLDEYRKLISDHAVDLLSGHLGGKGSSVSTIRAAIQVAQAVLLDALLHDEGQLRAGTRQMAETLTDMMVRMISAGYQVDKPSSTVRTVRRQTKADQSGGELITMPILDQVTCPKRSGMRTDAKQKGKGPKEAAYPSSRADEEAPHVLAAQHKLPRAPKRKRYL